MQIPFLGIGLEGGRAQIIINFDSDSSAASTVPGCVESSESMRDFLVKEEKHQPKSHGQLQVIEIQPKVVLSQKRDLLSNENLLSKRNILLN